ncbi:hypothetical protein HH800_02465 [Sphingobium yanoikuyae]|uniref:Uncharacterized protein n=1 Tax=Sphingobium yanoikuyae TaxID=13690 RepID=A0A6M4G1F1_SPHYA|nr:hypothetical protein [Sphingobium yanoikuyae]QJR01162.1 hypothetical protein HH800_02465 [Sphingobium yanoikuyae]
MTSTDTKADYTAEEIKAYEAYLSALAEHNITCARAGATTKQKMDAAFAADRALKHFFEVAGHTPHSTRSPEDIRTIERMTKEMGDMVEATRSAWSMIRAADSMRVIEYRASNVDQDDHNACVCLIQDAEVILRKLIAKADGA